MKNESDLKYSFSTQWFFFFKSFQNTTNEKPGVEAGRVGHVDEDVFIAGSIHTCS